jgi:hypothetical protein
VRRVLLLIPPLLAGLAAGGSRPVAAACTLTYRDSLEQVRNQLDTGSVAASAVALQQLADSSGTGDALEPVVEDLQASPPHLDDARRRLDAVIGLLAEPGGAVCGADTTAARAALQAVYRSPVFADLDRRPVAAPSSSGPTLSRSELLILVIVLAVILAAVVAFGIWRLRGVASPVTTVAGSAEPPGTGTDPAVEWRLADAAAAAGHHREAIRRAFRGALLDVAVAGRLTISASWTTRELLSQARADADLLAALAPAADSFDRAWYAGQAVSQGDWEQARARCETVRSLARRQAAGAVT